MKMKPTNSRRRTRRFAPNKDRDHILILPEDDANSDIANGFLLECENYRNARILPSAGGWTKAVAQLQDREVKSLRRFPKSRLVLIIDYDGEFEKRLKDIKALTPDDLSDRVYVIGSRKDPQELRSFLVAKGRMKPNKWETIGKSLADDCRNETDTLWSCPELKHNEPEIIRMKADVAPF